jgi:hypothetical protein
VAARGKLAIRFNRLWDKRGDKFIKQAAKAAGVDEETLLQRADQGDGFFDVFESAGRRVVEDGDPVVHDLFARLVASALRDDARIHEVSYMLTKLEALQSLHIRIITAMPTYDIEGPFVLEVQIGGELSKSQIAERINTSSTLIKTAIDELTDSGFVVLTGSGNYRLDWLGCAFRTLIESTPA